MLACTEEPCNRSRSCRRLRTVNNAFYSKAADENDRACRCSYESHIANTRSSSIGCAGLDSCSDVLVGVLQSFPHATLRLPCFERVSDSPGRCSLTCTRPIKCEKAPGSGVAMHEVPPSRWKGTASRLSASRGRMCSAVCGITVHNCWQRCVGSIVAGAVRCTKDVPWCRAALAETVGKAAACFSVGMKPKQSTSSTENLRRRSFHLLLES